MDISTSAREVRSTEDADLGELKTEQGRASTTKSRDLLTEFVARLQADHRAHCERRAGRASYSDWFDCTNPNRRQHLACCAGDGVQSKRSVRS